MPDMEVSYVQHVIVPARGVRTVTMFRAIRDGKKVIVPLRGVRTEWYIHL